MRGNIVGVNLALDERWAAKQPECGVDLCALCSECLGCVAGEACVRFTDGVAINDQHVWLNSSDEVLLV